MMNRKNETHSQGRRTGYPPHAACQVIADEELKAGTVHETFVLLERAAKCGPDGNNALEASNCQSMITRPVSRYRTPFRGSGPTGYSAPGLDQTAQAGENDSLDGRPRFQTAPPPSSQKIQELQKMLSVVQRVSQASVAVEGQTIGRIGPGLLVLLCAEPGDTPSEA